MRNTHRQRAERKEFGQPELTLARRGDGPDSRLREMVRLLARRAAREVYEQEQRERRTTRS